MTDESTTIRLPRWIHPVAALVTIASAAIGFWAFIARPFTALGAEVKSLATELRLERQANGAFTSGSALGGDMTDGALASTGGKAVSVKGNASAGGDVSDSILASDGGTVTRQTTGGAPAFAGLQAGGDLSIGLAERHPSFARGPNFGSAALKVAPLSDSGIPSHVCTVPYGTRLLALDYAKDNGFEQEYFYVEVAEGPHKGTRAWINVSNFAMGSDAQDVLSERAVANASRPPAKRIDEVELRSLLPPDLSKVTGSAGTDVARYAVQEWMTQQLVGNVLLVEYTCDKVAVEPTSLNTHNVSIWPRPTASTAFLSEADGQCEIRLRPFRFHEDRCDWENVDLDFVLLARRIAQGQAFKVAFNIRSLVVTVERDKIGRDKRGSDQFGPPYLLVQCVSNAVEVVE